ncbi:hypothetical protein SpCBS45565_g06633 [Spizellomyces sp. 'palustris']|nr:hypothetical protein SpCBS45565_g06633 [Spizellomyces sp. 'palustris']
MRLRYIDRTSTLAWSPGQHDTSGPLLATGTVAGALDASFSTAAELEIFDLNLAAQPGTPGSKNLRRLGAITCSARFNRLAWGALPGDTTRPLGVLASGMENGELDLWNPAAIIDGDSQKSLLMRHSIHGGPVRGLDFSPVQGNLLASGATDGEIYIWDLTNPTKPYTPGAKSQRLEDVSTLAWNRQVAYILGTASNNGYTVLWDLRHKKEIITLAHPGGRKPITALAWNPAVATQLVTASEDDNAPVLLVWDLRNASAPQKGLQGHQKGILSVSWCPKDSDLLLSSGKDNSTLAWNPTTGEMIGELARSNNWSFDVQWCPRNPDLVAISSFDGNVSVHSLQSSGAEEGEEQPTAAQPTSSDPFDGCYQQQQSQPATQFALRQPPKWLRRPVGATFGFGGKLVTFDTQSKWISIRTVPTEPTFAKRADELEAVMADGALDTYKSFCERRATADDEGDAVNETDREMWSFLKVMLESGAREQVLQYLGFDRSKVGEDRLAGLLQKLRVSAYTKDEEEEPLASVSEPPIAVKQAAAADGGHPNGLTNLFGASEAEFPEIQPQSNTITPEEAKKMRKRRSDPFSLYPSKKTGEQGDIDTLITKAIVLGDFETAVDIALGANRLSDALMLAVSGGPDLLLRTQQEYFKRQAKEKSYVRVLKSVVTGDLEDIVENGNLDGAEGGWKDILALICTYGKAEDSSDLFSALGRRLEATSPTGADGAEYRGATRDNKKFAAVLCYLAAGDLKKVVNIWSRREIEEEHKLLEGAGSQNKKQVTAYASHIVALQSLIEKVTVFRKAIGFVDPELSNPSGFFQLENLYDHYAEYADSVAGQGKLDMAWTLLELVPEGFRWTPREERHGPPPGTEDAIAVLKDRVYRSGGLKRQVTRPPGPGFEVKDVLAPAPVQYQGQQPYISQPANGLTHNTNNAWNQPSYTPGYGQQTGGQYYAQPQQPAYGYSQPATATYNTQYQPSSYGHVSNPSPVSAYPPPPASNVFDQQAPQPISMQHTAPTTGFNDPPMVLSKSRLASNTAPVSNPFPGAQQATAAAPLPPPPTTRYAQPSASPGLGRRTPGLPQNGQHEFTAQTAPGRILSPPPTGYQADYNSYGQPQPQQQPGYGGAGPIPTPTPPPPTPPIGGKPTIPNVGLRTATPPVYTGAPHAQAPVAQSGLASPGPARTPTPQRPPSAAPVASKYPPGDRSHIPAAHKPLYDGLTKYLDLFRSVSSAPQQRRIYDNAERNLNIMFDQLNAEEIPADVVDKMMELVKAMDAQDFATAHRIQIDLLTTRFDATGQWMLVVKRLIDAAERLAGGNAAAGGQHAQQAQPMQPMQSMPPMQPPPQQGPPPQHGMVGMPPPPVNQQMGGPGAYAGAPPPPMGTMGWRQ